MEAGRNERRNERRQDILGAGHSVDLKSQLENIASKAQGQAKNSFESVGKAASEAIQKPIEKVGNTVEKAADNVQKTTEECITAAGESLDAMVERALKPRNFEVEAKVTQAAAEPGAPRGPPKYAMAGPDPAKFIENYGKQAEKSTIPMEDIFQAADKPAELLKQKIENITTQITDQRENLLKLENALAKLGEEGGEESDKLAQKITAGEGRLISLQQTLMQTQAKYDKAMSAAAQATEKPKEAVDSLGEQIKSTLKSAASKGGKSVKNGLVKAFSSMKQNASKSVKDVGHKVSGLGRSIKSAFKSAVLMAGLYAAFRAFRDLVGGALTSNEQFAASLNALKGNLQVAFTPILQVIMPAVNALMSGLALAAQKIAAFTSSVFGKTYAQSVAAAKRLKSTSKEAKKAAGAVAGFDQLNNIEKSESEDTGETNLDTLAVGPKRRCEHGQGIFRSRPYHCRLFDTSAGQNRTIYTGVCTGRGHCADLFYPGHQCKFPDDFVGRPRHYYCLYGWVRHANTRAHPVWGKCHYVTGSGFPDLCAATGFCRHCSDHRATDRPGRPRCLN